MRLVSFGPRGQERLGALVAGGEKILDLNKADSSLPTCMLAFLNGNFWEKAKKVIADTPASALVDRKSVRLGAPIPKPGLILCVGLNYKDHATEQGLEWPKTPLLFGKSSNCATGPDDTIEYPEGIEQLDYEVELGVVIGKTAKKVPAAKALEYVAGYTVVHDVSARCAQFGDKQWFRGKSCDTFAPFGPALVTPDEVGDHANLKLSCKVNGEVRQNSNTNQLIHTVPNIIEYVTRTMTLSPGDVIATGTPSGVGVFFKPPKLLKRGDVVELEIEKLGKLTNKVV